MIKAAFLLPIVLGLGACASQIGYHGGELAAANEQLGQAVAQNIAAQTVNPQGSTAALVINSERLAHALDNYKTDKVEQPSSASTMAIQANSEGN
jgi:type III secretory pathway lipoprotein EscJ